MDLAYTANALNDTLGDIYAAGLWYYLKELGSRDKCVNLPGLHEPLQRHQALMFLAVSCLARNAIRGRGWGRVWGRDKGRGLGRDRGRGWGRGWGRDKGRGWGNRCSLVRARCSDKFCWCIVDSALAHSIVSSRIMVAEPNA